MRFRLLGLELSHSRSRIEKHPYYYTTLRADPDGKAHRIFEAQASFLGSFRWAGFSIGTSDGEGEWKASLGLWLASLYVDFGRFKRRKNRELSLHFHSGSGVGERLGYFSWRLWTDPDSWSSSTPKWRDGSFHLTQAIFGNTKSNIEKLGDPRNVELKMPEGSYTVKCTPERQTWTWPRFRKPLVKNYIHVEVEGGVPVPGKGESDWDCGDDAIISTAFETDSCEVAAGLLGQSVLETRKRYASITWKPSAA